MPNPFSHKTILLGVTGSIAIYKSCELCSRLVEAGATVHVAMTHSAQQLLRPAIFEALTHNFVITGLFERSINPLSHVTLAHSADLFIVAPATANILAKSAHGIADDWLSTALLSTTAPILWAPAMNPEMYRNPATQANIDTLRQRGHHFIGPMSGKTACGEVGEGRMADPPIILETADILLSQPKDLQGKKVLITSGPTQEPIDPVRYISNRSSGKMGRALAMEALRRSAEVTVVSGPATEPLPYHANVIRVRTASEMYETVMQHFPQCDIFIGASAVADYRVQHPAEEKHKRDGQMQVLELTPNPDIISSVSAIKKPHQITVGFAAETHHLIEYAKEKLMKKQLDLIIANQVGGEHCAFNSDSVYAVILTPDTQSPQPQLIPKAELTHLIFNHIKQILEKKYTAL